MAIDYKRININKINRKGIYFDINNNIIFKLKPSQLREIAIYQSEIKDMVDPIYFKDVKSNRFKLQRDNKYNKGSKSKRTIHNIGPVVIIGSLIIVIGLTSISKLVAIGKESQTYSSESYSLPEYEMTIPETSFTNISESNIEEYVEEICVKEESAEEILAKYRKECIKNCCAIYAVNYDIVYDKIVELTDNFSNEDFLSGHIDGVTCKRQDIYSMDEELLFVCTVRAMSQLPNNFGINKDELLNNPVNYEFDGDYVKLLNYYSKLFGVEEYKDLLYGIFYAETGGNSDLLINKNNFGGIRNPECTGFDYQVTPAAGAIEYIATVKYNYIGRGLDTPEEIQSIYCPESDGNNGKLWISNVYDSMARANEVFSRYEDVSGFSKN